MACWQYPTSSSSSTAGERGKCVTVNVPAVGDDDANLAWLYACLVEQVLYGTKGNGLKLTTGRCHTQVHWDVGET